MSVIRKVLFSLATSMTLALATAGTAYAQDDAHWLDLEMGKSVVLETPKNATAIAITDPSVADVIPLAAANKLQIQGKKVGSTDLVVQLGAGTPPIIYEITVHRDLAELVRRVDAVVEGSAPRIFPLESRIVVEGTVDDLDTLERVAQIAAIYDPDFVNLMSVKGDHQVQLEVMFSEISRSGLRELGLNFLWGSDEIGIGMQSTVNNSAASVIHPLLPVVNGGMTMGAAGGSYNFSTFIVPVGLASVLSVLDDYALSKTLAQPTMVSLSGQQADFLAGGEIPVPAPSGLGAITVQFKEYGVLMSFVPTVLANNVIDVRVDVELSEPDFASGTRLTGIEIPGFISRKAASHLRLESGMTFAMAGLLRESVVFSRAQVPILGQIPILGMIFRSIRHERSETELVVFVTPRLVRPLGPGEVPPPPGTQENNHPTDFELYLLALDHRTGSRTGEATPENDRDDSQPTGLMGMER
jgi:pilus assembly protein CpaC